MVAILQSLSRTIHLAILLAVLLLVGLYLLVAILLLIGISLVGCSDIYMLIGIMWIGLLLGI